MRCRPAPPHQRLEERETGAERGAKWSKHLELTSAGVLACAVYFTFYRMSLPAAHPYVTHL